jgi:hypothetical protein
MGYSNYYPHPPLLRNPFLMSILPWNFRKFSCKIYPFPWNFLVKITLAHGISILNWAFPWNFHLKFGPVHGISMCKLPLPMEFAAWEIYSRKFHLTYVLPWNFHSMKFTPPSEIPYENYSSPWNSRA